MKNFVQNGKIIEYTNATAAIITAGSLVIIGSLAGVAVSDIAINEKGSVALEGVYEIAKAAGAVTQGEKLYWITASSNLTTTASGNTLVGIAFEDALSAAAVARLVLTNGL